MIEFIISRYKSFLFILGLISKKTKDQLLFIIFLVFIQGIYQMFSVLMLLPLINSITADPSQVNISFLFFSNLTYLNSFLLCLFSIVSSFLVNYFVTRKTNLLISKCGYELASKTFDNLLSKDYSYYQNKDPSSLRQAICLELAQSIVGLFNPIIYILSSSIISLILIISIFIYYPNMVLVLCFSFLLSYPVFKWNQRLAPKTKLYEVKNHTQKLFSIIDISNLVMCFI